MSNALNIAGAIFAAALRITYALSIKNSMDGCWKFGFALFIFASNFSCHRSRLELLIPSFSSIYVVKSFLFSTSNCRELPAKKSI